jgi:hypothetical protein
MGLDKSDAAVMITGSQHSVEIVLFVKKNDITLLYDE